MPRRRREPSGDTSSPRGPKRSRRSTRSSRHLRDEQLGSDNDGRRFLITDEDFNENNAALGENEPEEELKLLPLGLELHMKTNRKAHRTDEYEQEELIVRRGQPFELTINFDQEFNKEADSITIQLTYGSRPQQSKSTLIRMKVASEPTKVSASWQAAFKSSEEKNVTVTISPSTEAIVGRYSIYVETVHVDDDGKDIQCRKLFDETLVVLFNAWCAEDQVYMENEEEKQEYVLNERGRVWVGTSRHFSGTPWNFGQFEDVCLEAALYLMDKAELGSIARCNASQVIRCISAMSNCNDDDGGVLWGRWADTYPKPSTVPWAWVGSVAILEEFMKTKKAVKYGQCWVFAGIVTTLLRALGIPTRSVTNFESAHDSDESMTADYHWSEDNEPLSDLNDSVWNFHVWNESWSKRYDLPPGYDGWQISDATPQEASDGIMRCGPCSLNAVKQGDVYLPYDTKFVFAEVNCDKVHWKVKKDGSLEPKYKEKAVIGKYISTKAVGSDERHDLTLDYKFGEATEDERRVVHKAFGFSSRKEYKVYDIEEPDVSFSLETPEQVVIGNDFELRAKLKNLESEVRNVKLRITAKVSYYTGVPSEEIKSESFEKELQANEESEVVLHVDHDNYAEILKPEAAVQVYLMGTVQETNRSYAHQDNFVLLKPGLKLQAPKEVTLREEFDVTLTFTNPLSEKLTGGVFHLEGAGITKSTVVQHKKAIGPGDEVTETVTLSAKRSGNKELTANFSSDQLVGVTGSTTVYVKYGA